jgi:tRNA nucleotidyltransferase (CCA-adding enzyme)
MNVPDYVRQSMTALSEHGFESYMVGGCVRDSILGLIPHDYDLCTNASPDQIKLAFSGLPMVTDGEKHGTITVIYGNDNVDITTYRTDGNYADHRHPDSVKFVSSISDDLSRRDFTVNAMALPLNGNLVDPFNGESDIAKKVIRCVGDPNLRFKEDPLRMLRAFRFSAKLGFLISPETLKGIRKNAYLIRKISKERIMSEMEGIMKYDPGIIEAMHDNCLLKHMFPKLDDLFSVEQNNPWHYTDVGHHTIDALRHSMKYQSSLSNDDLLTLRFALLFHDIGKIKAKVTINGVDHFYGHPEFSYEMTKDILDDYKYFKFRDSILKLIRYHDYPLYPKRKTLLTLIDDYQISLNEFKLMGYLRECDISAHVKRENDDRMDRYYKVLKMYEQKTETDGIMTENDLAISGNDIMRVLYLKPCKLVGEIKHDLYQLVFMNPSMNDRDTLIDYLEETYNKTE